MRRTYFVVQAVAPSHVSSLSVVKSAIDLCRKAPVLGLLMHNCQGPVWFFDPDDCSL